MIAAKDEYRDGVLSYPLPVTCRLSDKDHELIKAAEDVLFRCYSRGRHHVGAALVTSNGSIICGVHLDSAGIDVCAEAVALGNAVVQGMTGVECVVAVKMLDSQPVIVPPCGNCRELFLTFAPDAYVIVVREETPVKMMFRDLLPFSYTLKKGCMYGNATRT